MLPLLLAVAVTASPTLLPDDPWFARRDAALLSEIQRIDLELSRIPNGAPKHLWIILGVSGGVAAGSYAGYFLNQLAWQQHTERLRTPLGGMSARPPDPLRLDFLIVPAIVGSFSLLLSSVVTFSVSTNLRYERERLMDKRATFEEARALLRTRGGSL